MDTFETRADHSIDASHTDQRDIYGTPVLPDLLVRSEMARLRMQSRKRLSLARGRHPKPEEAHAG